MGVSLEDGIERHGNVYPFCVGGQQWGDYLMMALATREHPSLLDDFQHLWWKPGLRIIRYAYHYKLHGGRKFFTFHYSLFTL